MTNQVVEIKLIQDISKHSQNGNTMYILEVDNDALWCGLYQVIVYYVIFVGAINPALTELLQENLTVLEERSISLIREGKTVHYSAIVVYSSLDDLKITINSHPDFQVAK